jgi:hypothetical protein
MECSNDCTSFSDETTLSCTLTTTEFRQRKETVIKSLREQVLDKKELKNGFTYKFIGTDKMIDELTEFIKTERVCCNFFNFTLSVAGNASEAWLEITGPKGAKDFIITELAL